MFRALGDRWGQAGNLGALGHLYFCWGDRVAGRAMFVENITSLREFGDVEGVGSGFAHLGRDALAHDELEPAARLLDASLAIHRDLYQNDDDAVMDFLAAEIARRRGDYAQALRLSSGVLSALRKLGNRDFVASALDGQGRIARSQGDAAAAHALHREALLMRREAGHPITLAHSFHALALLVAARAGQAERAARLFGAAEPYHAALYAYWAALPIWRAEHEQAVAALQAQLGQARAAALWAEGEAMTLEQAFAYALET